MSLQQGVREPCPAFVAEGAAGTRAAVNPLIVPRHISATFSSKATTQQGLNHVTERAGKGNKTPAEQAASACTPQTSVPQPHPHPRGWMFAAATPGASSRHGPAAAGGTVGGYFLRTPISTHIRMASSLIPRAINRYFRRLRAPEEIG